MKYSIPQKRLETRNPRTSSVLSSKDFRKGDQYVIPRVRYDYQQSNWKNYMSNEYDGYRTIRSSFIPYILYKDQKYWILGSFHDFPKDILMDFGGSCKLFDPPTGRKQKIDYQHRFGCAILELNEESKGLLVRPVLKSLGLVNPDIYRGLDRTKKEDVWFVLVELDPKDIIDLSERFERAPKVLKGEELGPLDFYSEQEIIDKKYRTSRNLTDFVDSLRRQ